MCCQKLRWAALSPFGCKQVINRRGTSERSDGCVDSRVHVMLFSTLPDICNLQTSWSEFVSALIYPPPSLILTTHFLFPAVTSFKYESDVQTKSEGLIEKTSFFCSERCINNPKNINRYDDGIFFVVGISGNLLGCDEHCFSLWPKCSGESLIWYFCHRFVFRYFWIYMYVLVIRFWPSASLSLQRSPKNYP